MVEAGREGENTMNPIVVPIKSGSRDPYEVTVTESGGILQCSCTCPEESGRCEHLEAVRMGDRAILAHPEDVGKLDEARNLIRRLSTT